MSRTAACAAIFRTRPLTCRLGPDGKLNVGGGIGRGYLMVIKDIGLKDPVTGTVALVDGEIAEDLTRYFAESEQIPSACALGVLVDTDCTVKCAGGWLVQLMPGVKDADIDRLEANLAKRSRDRRHSATRAWASRRSSPPCSTASKWTSSRPRRSATDAHAAGKGRARADQPREEQGASQDDRRTGEK